MPLRKTDTHFAMSLNFLHVVGARPNFMKLAPLHRAIAQTELSQKIVHTGQHYDSQMSDVFFEQLQIPAPDYHLGVGSASHATQTAQIMLAFEPILLQEKPDCVVVYGDVNSTLAATLVAVKMGVKVAHVEAGLRSRDRTMPEELNRLLTDSVADVLLTPSPDANENLLREGIDVQKIHLVGNIMIDSLCFALTFVEQNPDSTAEAQKILERVGKGNFILSTVHRPANVDSPDALHELFAVFKQIAEDNYFVLPLHPRTRKQLENAQILSNLPPKMLLTEPLSYFDFIYLQKNAFCVLTDSGGIQEESTFLKVPCLTLRHNTERPITITEGTNELIGNSWQLLYQKLQEIRQGNYKKGKDIALWDGKTAHRIVEVLRKAIA